VAIEPARAPPICSRRGRDKENAPNSGGIRESDEGCKHSTECKRRWAQMPKAWPRNGQRRFFDKHFRPTFFYLNFMEKKKCRWKIQTR
jgi:hypothetical protein